MKKHTTLSLLFMFSMNIIFSQSEISEINKDILNSIENGIEI